MPTPSPFPPWVVLHVPHDAVEIPAGVRNQFLLDDHSLDRELLQMTDRHTLALFSGAAAGAGEGANIVRAPVSRLVIDVERFEDDRLEPMAAAGMGAVYETTSDLQSLRRTLDGDERETLLGTYYRPHHAALERAVSAALAKHGQCLIIDCHSFPSVALPYERRDPGAPRPDICIGTDDFHTSEALAASFVQAFEAAGWRVGLDTPFAGAIVPASRYRTDHRVASIMVEVNRRLYMDELTGARLPSFSASAHRVQGCCLTALAHMADT